MKPFNPRKRNRFHGHHFVPTAQPCAPPPLPSFSYLTKPVPTIRPNNSLSGPHYNDESYFLSELSKSSLMSIIRLNSSHNKMRKGSWELERRVRVRKRIEEGWVRVHFTKLRVNQVCPFTAKELHSTHTHTQLNPSQDYTILHKRN